MKLKKQQDRGRKHAKILAAMLVFLLCGCNHRDTEYKLSDSTGGSTAENVFGNQKEVDEEQTVSEKSAGETTGIPEKREAQEAENMEITETPQQNTGGTEQASGSGKVNLNTAGKEELMTLSGIGESRADAIIAYREANGPFGSIEEIMNIEGIKGKMFEKIRGSIEV